VTVLPVAVQIGGGHDHHQVGIVVGVGVGLVEEVRVEELIVRLTMAAMSSSSELLSRGALMLANGRTGCARPGRTALSTHLAVAVKRWPAAA
jgi:hypothetical protein